MKYKHIGVFLRGHLRTWEYCTPNTIEFFSKLADRVDYYISTWDFYDFGKLRGTFGPHNLIHVEISSTKSPYYNGDKGMTYLQYLSLPYKYQREKELGYEYDCIFDTRPDIYHTINHSYEFKEIKPNTIHTHAIAKCDEYDMIEDFLLSMKNDVFERWCRRYATQSRINCQVEPTIWAKEENIIIEENKWYHPLIVRPSVYLIGKEPNLNIFNQRNLWDHLTDETKIKLCQDNNIPLEDYTSSVAKKVKINEIHSMW
jgi:hypothetical protein